jgi:hypothetical protein
VRARPPGKQLLLKRFFFHDAPAGRRIEYCQSFAGSAGLFPRGSEPLELALFAPACFPCFSHQIDEHGMLICSTCVSNKQRIEFTGPFLYAAALFRA